MIIVLDQKITIKDSEDLEVLINSNPIQRKALKYKNYSIKYKL